MGDDVKAVVTGGAGFIGSHLCDLLLAQGRDVTCVDNLSTGSDENIRHLSGNARFKLLRHDVTLPLQAEADEIFNLACPASPVHYQRIPIETTKACVYGAINMLDLACASGAKILQASTSEVYGDPQVHPQTEAYWGHVNPIGTRSCYDEGKRCAEALFFDYWRRSKLPIKVMRIFNTYGPRMQPSDGRVVSNFIVQALRNEPITIYGDGSHTRSFCYVDDLVDAIARMMATPDDVVGPINIGNPMEVTILELAELVLRIVGGTSRIEFKPLPQDDPQQRQPDISLARSALDWSPRVALEDGLGETVRYFRRLIG
ncbi:SDR family NAD-dependent epimerase/dehydratase [Mesorhizobium hawassense]|uniref:SDR family NAD-dependent epimerase/dehydratase n=1 Tax=Mesorhizobium hawassense TaxID=1209954 RepID=A0A330I0Q6_9HYPH|nr:UDP-glucuronic acid decarboxylase family protein [Mesorhizobium hawassense]RAZ90567.1 SDR family NAD-dependent epimerase/dehydratase [Mesorhizobium hawassense]